MKKSDIALTAVILMLAIASVLSPLDPGHVVSIDPSLRHEMEFHKGATSLLVTSRHDLTLVEVNTLRSFGTVTTVAGPVAVLRTQMTDVLGIEGLGFISRIEDSHRLHVYLDKSAPDIGAEMVWREVKDPEGRNVTGAGIVMGFVDTGIDTTHPDFSFPNGTTKILYVWDQTTSGRPPAGFGYGYECSSEDIQERRCHEFDSFGHGTHVAGIAASSGRATGNFTGVAPDATIIFVKSGHQTCNGGSWTFDTSQILDGINYIVKKAGWLGRRVVINLSLGGNIGGHDGTDPLELGLDAFVRSGTPIVVAAGNSSQDNDHVHGQLSQGDNLTVSVNVRETTTDLAVDIWYSPQDKFEAALTTPRGETYTIPTPSGGARSTYGKIIGNMGASDLGKELYFEVNSNASLPNESWSITLNAIQVNSKGLWDAWVDTATCSFPGAIFTPGEGYVIDPYETIGVPGTARYVVTVGAYTTKTSWRGMNGQTMGRANLPVGDIAPFSSLGPTRDGRIKPDVVAPGLFIASARSSLVPKSVGDPDPFHRILAGTSMATPHVAGTIALMLQHTPNLEATEMPAILRATARSDIYTGFLGAGSPIWGFGKVDARTATGLFRLTLVLGGIPEDVTATISVDEKQKSKLAGRSWNDFYFAKGTIHTVAFDTRLQEKNGTAYILQGGTLTLTTKNLRVLNYTSKPLNNHSTVSANQTSWLFLNYTAVPIVASTTSTAIPYTIWSTHPLPLLVLVVSLFSVVLSIGHILRRRKQASSEYTL